MTANAQAPQAAKLLTSNEIKRLGANETFKGIFVVSSVIRKTDKNGKPYWEASVLDPAGTISAKIWGDAGWIDRSTPELEQRPDILPESAYTGLHGRTVGISGKTSIFRDQVQLNFTGITLLNQEKYPPTRYLQASEVPLPVLEQRFDDLVESCGEEMRGFLRAVFSGERMRLFRDLPAAYSNHHAYAHGLLEHTVTVAECAKAAANSYRAVYPTLDVDLVVAGALLHDIGKIESYRMDPVPRVTLEGAVLDHIAIGYAELCSLFAEHGVSREMRAKLGHIVLSHHGQKEFGSPVLPATLEALIVSMADELDFRLFCWKDLTKDLADGQEISAYHMPTQRRFWRPAGQGGESGD